MRDIKLLKNIMRSSLIIFIIIMILISSCISYIILYFNQVGNSYTGYIYIKSFEPDRFIDLVNNVSRISLKDNDVMNYF